MADTQDPIRKLGETDDLPFVEKLLAYFGDELTQDQVDALATELLEDGDKRDLFVATATMQQHLRRVERGNQIAEESILGGLAPEPEDAASILDPNDSNIYELAEMPLSVDRRPTRGKLIGPVPIDEHEDAELVMSIGGFRVYRGGYGVKVRHLAMAAALALVGVLAWMFWQGMETPAQQPTVVARIQQARNLKWTDTALPRTHGSELLTGSYKLTRGLLELRLNRGAEVVLEAPCEFQLLGANAMQLDEGKLVATVPPRAVNFTVKTDKADFVDLGTVFGISVDRGAGDTDAAVIDGRVIVNSQAGDADAASSVVELTRGQATTVRQDGSIDHPTHVSNDRINTLFGRGLDMSNRIVRKTDNIKALTVPPPSLEWDQLESDEHIFLLTEKQGVVLDRDLPVDEGGIERTTDEGDTWFAAPKGVRVRSYLLHADTLRKKHETGRTFYTGELAFSSQILGVIVRDDGLVQSDALFKLDGIRMESQIARSLDGFWRPSSPDTHPNEDSIVISEDRLSLRFRFKIESGIDECRIIVLDAPGESAPDLAAETE